MKLLRILFNKKTKTVFEDDGRPEFFIRSHAKSRIRQRVGRMDNDKIEKLVRKAWKSTTSVPMKKLNKTSYKTEHFHNREMKDVEYRYHMGKIYIFQLSQKGRYQEFGPAKILITVY